MHTACPGMGLRAVLGDLDGTLALLRDGPETRSPFDWHRVGEDVPNPPVAELWQLLAESGRYQMLLLSGRDGVCRPETEMWLAAQHIPYHDLLMRPPGDNRKDAVVKRELYDKHIAGRFEVVFVLDDRDQMVKMWREELGLPCFQVAYGNF